MKEFFLFLLHTLAFLLRLCVNLVLVEQIHATSVEEKTTEDGDIRARNLEKDSKCAASSWFAWFAWQVWTRCWSFHDWQYYDFINLNFTYDSAVKRTTRIEFWKSSELHKKSSLLFSDLTASVYVSKFVTKFRTNFTIWNLHHTFHVKATFDEDKIIVDYFISFLN